MYLVKGLRSVTETTLLSLTPPPLLAGVREDDHLLPQLPSDWTTAFPYGTVPLSIVCLSHLSVCLRASSLHLTCGREGLCSCLLCVSVEVCLNLSLCVLLGS